MSPVFVSIIPLFSCQARCCTVFHVHNLGRITNLITFLCRKKKTSPSFYLLIPIDLYRSCLVLTWCRWDNGKVKGSTCISRFLFSFFFATMNSLNQTFDAAKSAILSLGLVIRIQYEYTTELTFQDARGLEGAKILTQQVWLYVTHKQKN